VSHATAPDRMPDGHYRLVTHYNALGRDGLPGLPGPPGPPGPQMMYTPASKYGEMNWGKRNVFGDEMRFAPNYYPQENDPSQREGSDGGSAGSLRGPKGVPGPTVRQLILNEGAFQNGLFVSVREQGPRGDQGDKGERGYPGAKGQKGERVLRQRERLISVDGKIRPLIAQGWEGPPGPPGFKGEPGPPGPPSSVGGSGRGGQHGLKGQKGEIRRK